MSRSARLCTQCGAPLHGDTCEYCRVEYEPEKEFKQDDDDVLEVSPEEFRKIRCEADFFRNPGVLYHNNCQGQYYGKTIKVVPESKNAFVAMLEKGAISADEFMRLTGKEASFEQKSTGKEV